MASLGGLSLLLASVQPRPPKSIQNDNSSLIVLEIPKSSNNEI